MMRTASTIFYILALIAAISGVLFYVWVNAIACTWVTNGNCRTKMPWELGGEDFMFMVMPALSLTLICLLLGYICGRAAKG